MINADAGNSMAFISIGKISRLRSMRTVIAPLKLEKLNMNLSWQRQKPLPMHRVRTGNKYHAESSTHNGIPYHSKKEAAYASELDLRKKACDIKEWDRQIKISLDVNGFHICNYYVDFKILHNDGSLEYVEVKGFETDTWRLKWKLFEALYSNDKDKLTIVK